MSKRRCCVAMNKAGKPCGTSPLKGTDRCSAHSLTSDPTRFGSPAQVRAAGKLGGRPRLPSPTEIARKLIENNVAAILSPHFRTLGYEVELDPERGELVLIALEDGGAKLYGESKEGAIKVSRFEDLGAMMAAAEKLLDRIYGRPKQATELSGPGGGPVEHEVIGIPTEQQFHAEMAAVLAQAGANGNGNGAG